MKNLLVVALSALPICAMPFATGEARAQTIAVEVDRFELQEGSGDDPFLFDSTVSVGGERHALVLKAEGGHEAVHLDVEEVEGKLLYAFMPTAGTTLMAGVRHDFRPGEDLTYGTIAIEQTFGSLVEGEHYLFVSQDGDVTGAGQLLVGLPLAPAITLEPRLAVGWSAQAVPEEATGSGIIDVVLSARLRHAIGPVSNVYIGAVHERLIGDTRDIARANGESTQVTRALIGAGLSF